MLDACVYLGQEYIDWLENMEMENNERHVSSEDSLSIWRIYVRIVFEIKILMMLLLLLFVKCSGCIFYSFVENCCRAIRKRVRYRYKDRGIEKYKNQRWNQKSTTTQKWMRISENCVVWYRRCRAKRKMRRKAAHNAHTPLACTPLAHARVGKQSPNAIVTQWQWKNKRNLNSNSISLFPSILLSFSCSIQFNMTLWAFVSGKSKPSTILLYVYNIHIQALLIFFNVEIDTQWWIS